jgi:PIN domain
VKAAVDPDDDAVLECAVEAQAEAIVTGDNDLLRLPIPCSLAETLGVNQSEVSTIEHRADLYLSTLSEYVEALGGKLEIRAVFPGREVRISQFEELPK